MKKNRKGSRDEGVERQTEREEKKCNKDPRPARREEKGKGKERRDRREQRDKKKDKIKANNYILHTKGLKRKKRKKERKKERKREKENERNTLYIFHIFISWSYLEYFGGLICYTATSSSTNKWLILNRIIRVRYQHLQPLHCAQTND